MHCKKPYISGTETYILYLCICKRVVLKDKEERPALMVEKEIAMHCKSPIHPEKRPTYCILVSAKESF
jgi:hypothetical protein